MNKLDNQRNAIVGLIVAGLLFLWLVWYWAGAPK
jgi:hypothetical protein